MELSDVIINTVIIWRNNTVFFYLAFHSSTFIDFKHFINIINCYLDFLAIRMFFRASFKSVLFNYSSKIDSDCHTQSKEKLYFYGVGGISWLLLISSIVLVATFPFPKAEKKISPVSNHCSKSKKRSCSNYSSVSLMRCLYSENCEAVAYKIPRWFYGTI